MKPPYVRRDLDVATCGDPGCSSSHEEPKFIHCRRHIKAGLEVEYSGGVLTMKCIFGCKVCRIAVAKELPSDA